MERKVKGVERTSDEKEKKKVNMIKHLKAGQGRSSDVGQLLI